MKTAHWPLLWTFILFIPPIYYLYLYSYSYSAMASTEFKNPATTTLLELVKSRRTYYDLKGESPISDDAIDRIIQDSVLHVPSSFNTQTSRVVLLLKEEHKKVWDITIKVMEGLVSAGQVTKEMFENSTKPKLESFRAAYGTVCGYFVSCKVAVTNIMTRFCSLLITSPWTLSSNSLLSTPTSSTPSPWSRTPCPSTSVGFLPLSLNVVLAFVLTTHSLARS